MELNKFIGIKQYSLDKESKKKLLLELLLELHHHHLNKSSEYRKISKTVFRTKNKINAICDLPFLPVNLFKTHTLKSINDNQVYKVLTSSGTTGNTPSKVFLDTQTSKLQTLALSKIITHVIGNDRLPMLIVDSKIVLKDRKSFSARGAGILGLSVFGRDHNYMLDDSFKIDQKKINQFISKYNGQRILIFGFTFMIWKYLFMSEFIHKIDFSNAILIHSGGWKKLNELEVDNKTFKLNLYNKFGIKEIYNFYGMVEQVGSIYLENGDGYLHCPNFSDVIIRNPNDFSVQPIGEKGLVQVISVLPKSYPGHSILTEDIGVCLGEDDSSNGWKGKYFKILGRVKKAELRGCSDTFAAI